MAGDLDGGEHERLTALVGRLRAEIASTIATITAERDEARAEIGRAWDTRNTAADNAGAHMMARLAAEARAKAAEKERDEARLAAGWRHTSGPMSALDIIGVDRDGWKERAITAEMAWDYWKQQMGLAAPEIDALRTRATAAESQLAEMRGGADYYRDRWVDANTRADAAESQLAALREVAKVAAMWLGAAMHSQECAAMPERACTCEAVEANALGRQLEKACQR